MENQMNRVRTEEETGIEEEKSESIPVFVCVKTDCGRWREAEVGRWATAYGQGRMWNDRLSAD